MSVFPLEIVEKENSPELLAYLQQFGAKYYLTAEEINKMVQAIEELFQNTGSATNVPGTFGTFTWIKRGTDHSNNFPIAGDMFSGFISENEFSDALVWNGTGPLNNTNLANFNILNSQSIS